MPVKKRKEKLPKLDEKKCQFIKDDGKQCGRYPKPGKKYCYKHPCVKKKYQPTGIRRGPKEKPINLEELKKIAGIGCTYEEMADWFDVHPSTLEKKYSGIIKKSREKIKQSLRRAQIKEALKGNSTMLVWIGKQMLGQQDKQTITVEMVNNLFTDFVEVISAEISDIDKRTTIIQRLEAKWS